MSYSEEYTGMADGVVGEDNRSFFSAGVGSIDNPSSNDAILKFSELGGVLASMFVYIRL